MLAEWSCTDAGLVAAPPGIPSILPEQSCKFSWQAHPAGLVCLDATAAGMLHDQAAIRREDMHMCLTCRQITTICAQGQLHDIDLLEVANIEVVEAWPTTSVSEIEEPLKLSRSILVYCSLKEQTEIQSAWKNNSCFAKKRNIEV